MQLCLARVSCFLSAFVFVVCGLSLTRVEARELEKVTMEEEIQVDGKKLLLNGLCLRRKTVFGISVKVYVGGLYLEQKANDSDAIIASKETKRLVMQMLQNVDREKMDESFEAGFTENCVQSCDNKKKLYSEFRKHVPSVRKGDRLIFTYYPDKVDFEVVGANARKVTLPGADMSQNLLALFINKKAPPTPEFRTCLLGQ